MPEPKPEPESEMRAATEILVEHFPRKEAERKLAELTPFKAQLNSIDGGLEAIIQRQESFTQFIKGLEAKYGAKFLNYCEMSHFIRGSSLAEGALENTFFDFTGDDSIEKYLRDNFPEK